MSPLVLTIVVSFAFCLVVAVALLFGPPWTVRMPVAVVGATTPFVFGYVEGLDIESNAPVLAVIAGSPFLALLVAAFGLTAAGWNPSDKINESLGDYLVIEPYFAGLILGAVAAIVYWLL